MGARIRPRTMGAQSSGSCVVTSSPEHLSSSNRSRNDRRAVWGIGVHPGLVRSQRAFTAGRFRRLLSKTPVVGETGLDGSSRVPMSIQLETFRSVLEAAFDTPRILNVHSHQAQAEVLRELNRLPVQG